MNTSRYTQNSLIERLFWPIGLVVFIIICIRSYAVPIHHDEAATFFFYIQTGDYLPFMSHIDANNHVLNSTLSFICFKLFGDSLFSLRLPNTLSFLILLLGTWRLIRQCQSPVAKSILMGGLLLSFHFLSFFSTARGYGVSMALLVLALSSFNMYMTTLKPKEFLLFIIAFQLAISANLILVIVMLPLLAFIVLNQILQKQLNWKTILLHTINVGLLYYWVRFSFFLQENNALYYGEGESYYKTTYLSLSRLLSGYDQRWIAYIGSGVLILTCIAAGLTWWRRKPTFRLLLQSGYALYTAFLVSLIFGFYLLKKCLGVNYPEDRTGLFLYVAFILCLAFVADAWPFAQNTIVSILVLVAFGSHFALAMNFRKHSLINYETVPQRFYEQLEEAQAKQSQKLTVGGHRMRELFYAYENYRHGSSLNLMDGSNYLCMQSDYAIALKNEKPYYDPYYSELDTEPDWNYVLLKRKSPVTRHLRLDLPLNLHIDGDQEFYDIFKKQQDTLIEGHNPILAEFEFEVQNKDVPNRALLVMQIDTADGSDHYYFNRVPLNWLHYKWDEHKTYTYDLASGPLHKRLKSLAFYVYNPSHQHISMTIRSFKLYELEGEGVQAQSQVLN